MPPSIRGFTFAPAVYMTFGVSSTCQATCPFRFDPCSRAVQICSAKEVCSATNRAREGNAGLKGSTVVLLSPAERFAWVPLDEPGPTTFAEPATKFRWLRLSGLCRVKGSWCVTLVLASA